MKSPIPDPFYLNIKHGDSLIADVHKYVPMNRLRFSTRTAFIAMTLFAAYFAASRLYQNWFAHRYYYYVSGMKLAELQNGMSFERVKSSYATSTQILPSDLVDLGPTKTGKIRNGHDFTNASPSLINMVQGVFRRMEPGDELYLFEDSHGLGGSYLQFRDGLLVGHRPTLYVPTPEYAKINYAPFPSFALRFGVLPYFTLLVITALCVVRLINRHQSKRASSNVAP